MPLGTTFLSTPSARRATAAGVDAALLDVFLSTPSARRATYTFSDVYEKWKISIHALREEGDRIQTGAPTHGLAISIHALREEGDICFDCRDEIFNAFLSTPSARRATRARYIADATAAAFLSTPSARRAT